MGTHEDAVAAATNALELAREKAEAIASRATEVTSYVTAWVGQAVQSEVVSKPEHTAELGTERLALMKAELEKIKEGLPALVAAALSKDDLWPHRQADQGESVEFLHAYTLQKRFSAALDETVRGLIGDAGALLVEFGYEEASDQSAWRRGADGSMRYAYSVSSYGDKQLSGLKTEYGAALEEWVSAGETLHKAQSAKASAEAQSMWDEV